jgi:uncharacterized membrane protein
MASVASTELGERLRSSARIESIDFLRGLIMVIMAIDHIRDFFHYDAFFFSPSDVTQTTPAIFFTRWITHLCSPGFIFLAGVSAYFIRQRKSRGETAYFLVTRGLWLIILQFTVIRLAWNFDPLFHYNGFTIISVIGVCMIFLAGLIYLPWNWILIFSLVMIGGHNLLDGISFPSGSVADVIWSVLHVHKLYHLSGGYSLEVLFPIIPWVGVMSLGYCFGKIYDSDFSVADRRRIWLRTGVATLVVLFVLRYINVYGDPVPWSQQANWWRTFLSYLNFEKYPPSLYYVGIMLGILFVILGAVEGRNLDRWKPVTLFGKVALFCYSPIRFDWSGDCRTFVEDDDLYRTG